jgi:hypothetical protein
LVGSAAPAGPDQSEAEAGRPPAAILPPPLSPHVRRPAGENSKKGLKPLWVGDHFSNIYLVLFVFDEL